MKTFIATRKPNTWTNFLTPLLSLTFMLVWLPTLRSVFVGSSYEWGTSYYGLLFGGAGVNADFLFLVVQLLFYTALFTSMFWARKRIWFYWLLIVWFLHVFGNLLADIAINGDTVFHGDTLNVHISITWIVVPLSVLALMLVARVVRTDRKAPQQQIPWNTVNTRRLWLVFGLLPVQAVLLAIGEPHGTTDEIGVIIAIVQCFILPWTIRPFAQKKEVGL